MTSDTFRKTYCELNSVQLEQIDKIKNAAAELESLINGAGTRVLPPSRHTALAITNLEQAVMWAVKAWS